MITFADLLSLLLSFFVMLFATTSIDRAAWERKLAPITEYLGGHVASAPGVVVRRPGPVLHDTSYVAALAEHLVGETPSLAGMKVVRGDGAVALTLPAALAGEGEGAAAGLAALGRFCGGFEEPVEIVVHAGADRDWAEALAAAGRLAAALSKAGQGRGIAASTTLDLADGAPSRLELVVGDENAPR
jgi:hypothetical protein